MFFLLKAIGSSYSLYSSKRHPYRAIFDSF